MTEILAKLNMVYRVLCILNKLNTVYRVKFCHFVNYPRVLYQEHSASSSSCLSAACGPGLFSLRRLASLHATALLYPVGQHNAAHYLNCGMNAMMLDPTWVMAAAAGWKSSTSVFG